MIALTVDNSTCKIEGLSGVQMIQVKKLLSYEEKAYGVSGHRNNTRYLINKKGEFPTGLLYLVKGWAKDKKIVITDLRKRPSPKPGLFDLNLPYAPYPEQKAAAQACDTFGRGMIVAPTGVGKSAIAALIIQRLQVRTLIVVPSLELKRQLVGTLRRAFGASQVGGYGHDIWVENVDGLTHLANTKLKDYDCIIIDEIHHAAAKTYRTLNKLSWSGIYYKFGLTATPFRSQDHERLLFESILSKVIYRIEYADAVDKGYIVPIEAYYIDLPKQEHEGGETWASVYSELVVNNKARNDIIVSLINNLKDAGLSTLTLVKEIAHGTALSKATGVGFANGQDINTRLLILEFILGEIKSLIGTTGVIGEGIDTRPAEYAILAAGGKSKNAFMQQVGRVLRISPGRETGKVIIFRDRSHRWLLQHYNAQKKILLDEYGVVPVKLEV